MSSLPIAEAETSTATSDISTSPSEGMTDSQLVTSPASDTLSPIYASKHLAHLGEGTLVSRDDEGDVSKLHKKSFSNQSFSRLPTFDKDGRTITAVGHPNVKSVVPLDLLQSLYLPLSQSHDDRFYHKPTKTVTYATIPAYPPVRLLNINEKKRILVTGGAGFVGSHLVDRLMVMGHDVVVLDNFFTGAKTNVAHWIGHPHFELIRHDVVDPFMIEVDQIYHLACPASPPHYQYNPVKTVKTSFLGTMNMLGLAKRVKARFLLTSTSEVYGDPEEHPQKETYWGHVNPIGPRACYDEGKRVAETLTYGYRNQDDVDVRVARIFNTFGPRMNPNDGRVVSIFVLQALKGKDLTIYGDGSQTRSFQYVHDLIDGLILLMNSDYSEPVNLGNSEEFTIKQFAEMVRDDVNPNAKVTCIGPAPKDDPQKRRPDITRANEVLDWQPRWTVKQGIHETVEFFQAQIELGVV